jgi:O-acetyl-ADP-ribose deacetylase (regulator of RNase III)
LAPEFVIHTRGPNYSDIPEEDATKAKTMKNSIRMSVYTVLDTASKLQSATLGLSPISTGHF